MIKKPRVAETEEEEKGGTAHAIHDSAKRWEMRDLKKGRPNLKLILALFLLSYALAFLCISSIIPIAQLYSSKREIYYTNINMHTHMVLHNHLLEITQQQQQKSSVSESNPQPHNLDCASLIHGKNNAPISFYSNPSFESEHGSEINFEGCNVVANVGRNNASGGLDGRGFLCCDRSHFRTDVCYLKGDVRTHSQEASIFLHADNHKTTVLLSIQEKIRPYTRKWEESVMSTIDEITLKTEDDTQQINSCQVQHAVPAILFSTGGYTGNLYHEFNDGLLPLYITSQHLQGEVVFVILEYHNWWMSKYEEIVNQLTSYPVIDFSRDRRVHCFPEMVVGLNIHDELSIDPGLMKDGKSIGDFRALISKAYAPRLSYMSETDRIAEEPTSFLKASGLGNISQLRPNPKLVIISRQKSRVMTNQQRIVKLAQKIGFRVQVLNPKTNTEMVDMFRALNSCDVMVGVHGAAMTHFLFMRPGAVFIQIVPLGTDWAAATYYGEPATKLGLKYIGYKILPEESSLFAEYERNDPVLRDPESINRKGWWETKRVYLDGQNVKPSLKRLKKTLLSAYSYAQARGHGNLTSSSR